MKEVSAGIASAYREEFDPFFDHGGRLDLAGKIYPSAPKPWLDLSTGISPWGYPCPHLPADGWRTLPDVRALSELIEVARAAYRAPEEAHVIALAGSEAAIGVLPWLVRRLSRVSVVGPTYGSHAAAWAGAGHYVREVEDLERATAASIAVVVNPNNPDGRLYSPIEVMKAAQSLTDEEGLLIVDEAFADLEPEQSVLHPIIELDRVLVLRSFGKFYGAAGVRLGFAITSHPIAHKLKGALGAWPVSAAAVAFGKSALSDPVWAERHRANLKAASGHLRELLQQSGLTILGGTALFAYVGHPPGIDLFDGLAQRGIFTRPFKGRCSLRIGLPGDEGELTRLGAALKAVLNAG